MKLHKSIFIVIFLVIPVLMFAQYKVTLLETLGNVEIKGVSDSAWKKAKVGTEIQAGTLIATGLKSNALIMIGQSRLHLKALTRIEVKEYGESPTNLQAEVYVITGRISANVQDIGKQQQTLIISNSNISTIASNATLDFDGITVDVQRGQATITAELGASTLVSATEAVKKVEASLVDSFFLIPSEIIDVHNESELNLGAQQASLLLNIIID